MALRRGAAALLLALSILPQPGLSAEAVAVPSVHAGTSLVLHGHWFPKAPAGAAPAPAVLLLHGCGGLWNRRGEIDRRYTDMAARLNAIGMHALAIDSLRPRGERELCTQAVGTRTVTQRERRRDALAALQWLAAQPGVDAARLGLLGWSNGGSSVLAASNLRHPEVRAAAARASLAVAFYPGCEAELRRGFSSGSPLLLLLGEADDWTPAAPCKTLAQQAGPAVSFVAYAGAHHGFDGQAALRLRRDVPGGANPGQGVHVGADPAARADAALQVERFIRTTWNLPW